MRLEIPECRRCCGCVPLRHGVLVFGYLNLVCIYVTPVLWTAAFNYTNILMLVFINQLFDWLIVSVFNCRSRQIGSALDSTLYLPIWGGFWKLRQVFPSSILQWKRNCLTSASCRSSSMALRHGYWHACQYPCRRTLPDPQIQSCSAYYGEGYVRSFPAG